MDPEDHFGILVNRAGENKKKIFISNFRVFSFFRIFDPVPEKLYFFWFSTGEWPPAGPHFPLLVEGMVIFGHHFRPPSSSLIE
jgi:hypothetical protein